MAELARFGVSIESALLQRFDKFIKRAGYVGRSEAFRDLIRAKLIEDEIENDEAEVTGVLTLVYEHHQRELDKKLTAIQHDFHHNIISGTHVHLDHDNCLEVILLKGKAKVIKTIGLQLSSLKGVKHSKLVLTSASSDASHRH